MVELYIQLGNIFRGNLKRYSIQNCMLVTIDFGNLGLFALTYISICE